MRDLAPLKAIPMHDGAMVSMRRGDWRHDIPATELPSWIGLYHRLRDRSGGKYAQFFEQPVAALEAVATRIGVKIPPQKKAK